MLRKVSHLSFDNDVSRDGRSKFVRRHRREKLGLKSGMLAETATMLQRRRYALVDEEHAAKMLLEISRAFQLRPQ